MPRRVPARSLAVLAVALLATGAVVWWVRSLGGPTGVRNAFGPRALAVTVPAHIVTTLTPLGEVIPFGAADGALYGLWLGAALNWLVWMTAASLQYASGRGAAAEVGERRGPTWIRRLPLTHPLVLTVGR